MLNGQYQMLIIVLNVQIFTEEIFFVVIVNKHDASADHLVGCPFFFNNVFADEVPDRLRSIRQLVPLDQVIEVAQKIFFQGNAESLYIHSITFLGFVTRF